MGDFCRFFHIRTIPRKALPHSPYKRSACFASALSLASHHPCLPSKKGEVLLLGQAEQLWWGLLPICTINEIFHTIPRLSPTLPNPHYPTLSTTFLAPLPKGAGLPTDLSIPTTFSKAHPSPRPAPSPLPPLSKVRCCRPKKFGRLPEGLLSYRTLSVSQTPPLTIHQSQ